MADSSVGEEHLSFTQWAVSQGVKINGVAPAKFPGRGLGMVATRDIEEDEIILTVPLEAMLTVDCLPPSFVNLFGGEDGISNHGLLAAFLTHGDPEILAKWDSWRKVWPTRQEFEDSMPILWPEHLRASNSPFHSNSAASRRSILPPCASGLWNTVQKKAVDVEYEAKHQNLLAQQEERLQTAWRYVVSVFPDIDWETFSYYWLIVNSRSFFYVTPGGKTPEDRNDAVALVPFADYFNHSDEAECEVVFDRKEYTFKATRKHEKGEEIYCSYGPHPSDFLFIEYGFYPEHNECDTIYLDDLILGDLTRDEKEELELQQYLGNYQVTSAGACFRTEVAACMKYMTRKDWRNYVLGHSTRGMNPLRTADVVWDWIESYWEESRTTIGFVEEMLTEKTLDPSGTVEDGRDGWEQGRIAMALGRWKQIRGLCEDAMDATR